MSDRTCPRCQKRRVTRLIGDGANVCRCPREEAAPAPTVVYPVLQTDGRIGQSRFRCAEAWCDEINLSSREPVTPVHYRRYANQRDPQWHRVTDRPEDCPICAILQGNLGGGVMDRTCPFCRRYWYLPSVPTLGPESACPACSQRINTPPARGTSAQELEALRVRFEAQWRGVDLASGPDRTVISLPAGRPSQFPCAHCSAPVLIPAQHEGETTCAACDRWTVTIVRVWEGAFGMGNVAAASSGTAEGGSGGGSARYDPATGSWVDPQRYLQPPGTAGPAPVSSSVLRRSVAGTLSIGPSAEMRRRMNASIASLAADVDRTFMLDPAHPEGAVMIEGLARGPEVGSVTLDETHDEAGMSPHLTHDDNARLRMMAEAEANAGHVYADPNDCTVFCQSTCESTAQTASEERAADEDLAPYNDDEELPPPTAADVEENRRYLFGDGSALPPGIIHADDRPLVGLQQFVTRSPIDAIDADSFRIGDVDSQGNRLVGEVNDFRTGQIVRTWTRRVSVVRSRP